MKQFMKETTLYMFCIISLMYCMEAGFIFHDWACCIAYVSIFVGVIDILISYKKNLCDKQTER